MFLSVCACVFNVNAILVSYSYIVIIHHLSTTGTSSGVKGTKIIDLCWVKQAVTKLTQS